MKSYISILASSIVILCLVIHSCSPDSEFKKGLAKGVKIGGECTYDLWLDSYPAIPDPENSKFRECIVSQMREAN